MRNRVEAASQAPKVRWIFGATEVILRSGLLNWTERSESGSERSSELH